MHIKSVLIVSVYILITFNAYAEDGNSHQTFPEPASWSFPDVIESAREISPQNIESKTFNKYGLAYSSEELSVLPISTMSAQELQKYADIVTHAYPDAVYRGFPSSCKQLPLNNINETSLANMAFVSLNAIESNTRDRAATCLSEVQDRMRNK